MLAVPFVTAHNPASNTDTHFYLAGASDVIVGCKLDEDHGGAIPETGIGGDCIDFGTDLAGGTQVGFVVTDNNFNPTGGVMRIVSSTNQVLQPNTPFCGEYPEGGGLAPLPAGAFRMWIFVQAAGAVVNCLAFGEVGFPTTGGKIVATTA